jgi:hypothetical protein
MHTAPLAVARRPSLPWWLGCLLLCTAAAAVADAVQEVIDATRFAYGLEAAYWEDPGAFPTYDKLYGHYRQGFSPDLAAAMTAHTLASDGDLATWVPEQVFVAELGVNEALVWFPTPAAFGRHGLWALEDYMHLRLRRDGGRWVVYWGRDKSAPPAQ